jgi:hemerythrin-like domain-containing protein
MHPDTAISRRQLLRASGGLAVGMVLPVFPSATLAAEKMETKGGQEISPIEDLMREHGVLRRILLIYEESIKHLSEDKVIPPGVIADSAEIVRHFIEDYHEKLEEDEIFPRFQKTGKLDDLVTVLFVQHQAGRHLTEAIIEQSKPAAVSMAATRQNLISNLQQFIRMYRPHAAREDTVLFPAMHSIISKNELREMGEKFEEKEQKLFGEQGFESMVDKVAGIEKKLGINDLSQFTPNL